MGIRRLLAKFKLYLNFFNFKRRKFLYGFEYANLYIKFLDKESIKYVLKKYGASIGENCDIETGITFHNCKDYSNLIVGNNSHIGKNCFFDLADVVSIGNNVVISMNCTIITHLNIHRSSLEKKYKSETAPVRISDNAYIGASVMILKGVSIGNESLVAAGSVVKDSFGDREFIAGNPAIFKKKIQF